MRWYKTFILFVFIMMMNPFIIAAEKRVEPVEVSMAVTRIAFGSCNKHNVRKTIWSTIARNEPEVFIWTGDIVYADTTNPKKMRRKYRIMKKRSAYQDFIKKTKVIGVWDDHDYGEDDAGKEYPMKVQSQQILLDFLDEPLDSLRRQQEGIYTSYDFGTDGKRVKMILLDTRYFRDQPGTDSDILGEKQWDWLRKQLIETDADIHLIISSVQFLGEDHEHESWGRFPKAKQRMFNLLEASQVPGVIFISGDRHFAELSVDRRLAENLYPIYEITASGLTHSYKNATNQLEPNRFRIGHLFGGLNFGMIEVDWEQTPVIISLKIKDKFNVTVRRQDIGLDVLTAE